MKDKVSATVEHDLVEYLDSLPGENRSEKLERVLRAFRALTEDHELRMQLGTYSEDERELVLRESWERTVAEAMWTD